MSDIPGASPFVVRDMPGGLLSIDAVVAELREALARLPTDLLLQAATDFAEARTILAAAGQGTSRPETEEAIQALSSALAQVGSVHETVSGVRGLVEQYLAHIAGGEQTGAAAFPPRATTPAPRLPSVPGRRPVVDRDLVIELVRRGTKITPEKVVRIGRDMSGRVVWLEEGNPRAGIGHLFSPSRINEFADTGIAQDEIVEVVFKAATSGEPIGISGKDRVVFAVDHRGARKLIAVTVSDNGYIVGAHPITSMKKVKPLA